ncbi:unnamed protein product [Orchesella dallaii]|uniref:Uncharacterized protein n=1 Tax=Orchesella dallaii TaxID=48710 RepID=A0ABP1S135_9HEXA
MNEMIPISNPTGLPKFVKCTHGSPQKSGLEATTLMCEKCARKEVYINATFADDDPCFTRIPKCCGGGGVMGAANVLHKNSHGVRPRICVPHKGPLTEYRDQYRRLKPNSGPRQTHFSTMVENRPHWNPSISLPRKPYVESFEAAESKLKALDRAEEPIPEALLIARQRVHDDYWIGKNPNGKGGNNSGPVSIKPQIGSRLELYEDDSLSDT